MKSYLKSAAEAVRDQLESWGQLWRPSKRPSARLDVFQVLPGGERRLVGHLSQEGALFVFQYSAGFISDPRAVPITGFPDLREVYRSEELWPFFAIRVPPLEREDIREVVANKQLSTDDPLRLLAHLARRSVSSPYELADAGAT